MTTNHHTDIANGAAANAAIINSPDGQLDAVITDMLDGSQAHTGLLAGSGTLHATAIAEMDSTTLGLLPPRMTTTQRDAISSPADGLLIYNITNNQLEFAEASAWAAVGGAAAGTSKHAILRDEKSTGTDGGSSSAATWNARDLNTEVSDDDSIVSIASDEFTPISGDYIILINAVSHRVNSNRIRLFNVTGAVSVEEGIASRNLGPSSIITSATLICKFTANGTDAYRIDHYTGAARATDGLGFAVNDGSAEVYMTILLERLP